MLWVPNEGGCQFAACVRSRRSPPLPYPAELVDGINALPSGVLAPARTSTVLVVEDDPLLRDLYRQALTAARYRTLAVTDGLTALALIDEQMPDVLVLDLALPRVSGWDVYRDLRSRPETRTLPIIIVSGNDPRDIANQDFVWVFSKPVDPETLIRAVDRASGVSTS